MATRYAFDNDWQLARQRLEMLEAWTDPGTIQHLEARGIDEGWHCLEVGAGGGSITEWLCERVGDGGRVVATDINTRFVEQLDHPALDVRQHNVAVEELPSSAFDLVHTRAVLGHLPQREEVLSRLAAALKPGGWLLVEEFDFVSTAPHAGVPVDTAELYNRAIEAHNVALAARGVDVFYGRSLLGDFRKQPLTDVEAEGRVSLLHGGTAGGEAWRLTFEQMRVDLLNTGLLTNDEVDTMVELLSDEHFMFMSQVTMAAWGRRPVA